MTQYIFITGGVVSSLGKGITSASLGAVLEARGLVDADAVDMRAVGAVQILEHPRAVLGPKLAVAARDRVIGQGNLFAVAPQQHRIGPGPKGAPPVGPLKDNQRRHTRFPLFDLVSVT